MKKSRKAGKAVPTPPSETLREAISESGKTLYRVSKDSGVAYATLHRFIAGQRDVSMHAMDKLCVYLELELTPFKEKERD